MRKTEMRDLFRNMYLTRRVIHLGSRDYKVTVRNGMHLVKAKLLELRVFFVFFVRVYLQLVVIVYSFLLLYCLLSFWCHHRRVMLRNLSSFLV